MYFLTSFITPSYQKFLVTNSVVFHCPPCPPTSILWYSWIISALSFLSLRIYTFLFLNISSSSSCHFSSLNIFTPAHFISSTAFITSSSFASDFLIFSDKSTSSITISTTCVTLISSYCFFYQHSILVISLYLYLPVWMLTEAISFSHVTAWHMFKSKVKSR